MDIIKEALKEDFAKQDVTTNVLIPAGRVSEAFAVAKQDGVICGTEIFKKVFKELDPGAVITIFIKDGKRVKPGQKVAKVRAKTRAVLSGERTALNFIQHLSGIATMTTAYARALAGSKTKVYDTRKTIPGLRELEKYAVRCGGGVNHRLNLREMAMIKDNHLLEVKDLSEAVLSIKKKYRGIRVEVECEDITGVNKAVDAGADIIMFDNMGASTIKEAIAFIKHSKINIETEISGGINLSTIAKYKNLGADRISVGAITHSAPALDISLDIVKTSDPGYWMLDAR